MSHHKTVWWLIGGIVVVAALVVVTFVGFRSGTFALFGAGQQQSIVDTAHTNGYCYGTTQAGGFEGRKLIGECQSLYDTYKNDGDPLTTVTSWCALRGIATTCQVPPFTY